MSDTGTIFQRGDLVWTRIEQGYWERGIVTDVFIALVTGKEVVVVHGDGFYAEDVMPDTGDVPEQQALKVAP